MDDEIGHRIANELKMLNDKMNMLTDAVEKIAMVGEAYRNDAVRRESQFRNEIMPKMGGWVSGKWPRRGTDYEPLNQQPPPPQDEED